MAQDMNQPNIVLVVWDTLRPSNLSCYGYNRPTTPTLDKLADQSILYRRAASASPWSLPSHASLFSGLYPSQHNVDRRRNSLRDVETPVLAESLADRGYQTVGFTSNTWITAEFGFDRGFERFFYSWQLVPGRTDFFEVNRKMKEASGTGPTKLLAKGFLKGTPLRNIVNGLFSHVAYRYDKGAWLTNKQIGRWLRRDRDADKPFFMFINFMEPHLKYKPPSAYRMLFTPPGVNSQSLQSLNQDAFAYIAGAREMAEEDFVLLEALYDAEIRYLDRKFEELLEMLEEQGVLDNSIVIVTSDHGENIGDHGLMDHEYCLYETLLNVPLLIRMPGSSYGAAVVDQMVETKEIFFTVLDFLGLEERRERLDIEGYSLLPDRLAYQFPEHCLAEYLQPQPSIAELNQRYPGSDCSQFDRGLRAIYANDGYKFIWSSDGKHELYDLKTDFSETQNLVTIEDLKANELNALLENRLSPFEQVTERDSASEEQEMDAMVRKRLEELGYL